MTYEESIQWFAYLNAVLPWVMAIVITVGMLMLTGCEKDTWDRVNQSYCWTCK